MNVWLMKTFKEWAERFMNATEQPFVAIDEDGVDCDYGQLSDAKREKLFKDLAKEKDRRWGLIKRFFDEFYDEIEVGDIVVLGIGQASKFNVYAIVRVTGDAYYVDSEDSWDSRHRRNVEILWIGEPFLVKEWGWARRLERLDTEDRLKEFIKVYTNLK